METNQKLFGVVIIFDEFRANTRYILADNETENRAN